LSAVNRYVRFFDAILTPFWISDPGVLPSSILYIYGGGPWHAVAGWGHRGQPIDGHFASKRTASHASFEKRLLAHPGISAISLSTTTFSHPFSSPASLAFGEKQVMGLQTRASSSGVFSN
jgi:hypothetical protein